MIASLSQDKVFAAKLGLKANLNFIPQEAIESLSVHASTQLKSNFANFLLWRTHAFVRYVHTWDLFLQGVFTGEVGYLK